MRINSISNYKYRNNNPSFEKVKEIKFEEEFNPNKDKDHLDILNTFRESKPIKKCCEENDVNITFRYHDIDVYETLTKGKILNEYAKEKYNTEKGKHIHVTSIDITDANDKKKNYLYIMDDSEDKKSGAQNVMHKITSLRPDFYRQDINKYITLPYLTEKFVEIIKSW